MFVSLIQRLVSRAVARAEGPLQSRADQNTRKPESGGQPEKNEARGRADGGAKGRMKATQSVKTTKAVSLDGTAADTPGNLATARAELSEGSLAKSRPGVHPQAASQRRDIVNAQAKKTMTPARAAVKSAPAAAVKKATKAVKAVTKKSAIVTAQPAAKAVHKKELLEAGRDKSPGKPVSARAKAPAQPPHIESKSVSKSVAKAIAKPLVPDSKASKIADRPTKSASAAAAPAPAPVASRTAVRMASAPLKPGRRSSARTAVHSPPPAPMVPTHAPDAAKASYSTMIERVIAPPIHAAAPKDPKLANNWKSKPADQLTDEEVKAMPDSEYMNEKQLAFFRHKLSVLKQDIHNSAGETTEHLREDTSVVPDPADRATIEEEHALELRTRDRERKLLKKIEQSIARIDSGDYGYCDETGEAIGVGRLIARPTANLSLEAQQRRELKQKMFGD
jgi:DnaK suppressor protein